MMPGWLDSNMDDIDDLEDVFELMFSCGWGLVVAIFVLLLLFWLFLYLLSLRNQYNLAGKHVLITGGSSGIGKAVAKEALLRGAEVVTILARNEEKLEATKSELERLITPKLDQRVNTISADVCSEELQEELEIGLSGLPPVDVLINSAGITFTASFQDTTPQDFEKQLQVNVLGSVRPTKVLLPDMIEKQQGRIVFISSMAGQTALYGYTAYSASKYAVRGLAEVLDMELKVHNIRVSVSFPPDTDTPMLQGELGQRSPIVKAQAGFGSVFKAESVARDICRGIERGKFLITHGFDGFLLGVIATGMSPVYHWATLITEVVCLGLFRLVGCVYITLFYNIVRRETKKAKKQN
ncbi:3-ketodihydrosphingosine reductase [Geodia barretti]|uniref:3-dehydrosphinganine reductase n=1 Tax=Geodia barretti TaxID=519541 RepID=A0AA35RSF9_GEOBA|nr:3-ketodihydrosphingosine reductase [Geodia barretti]